MCRQASVVPLVHMITDGRDTLPSSALNYLPALERALHEAGGAIASIMGRFYAMDRDNRWDRTETAWRALMLSNGESAKCAESGIRSAYHAGDTDEFIRPILLPAFEPVSRMMKSFFQFQKRPARAAGVGSCREKFCRF